MVVAVVYVPFKNKSEAEKICSVLLKEKLISCANFLSASSIYFWKGKVAKAKEVIAICKTKPALVNRIELRIKALHSYDVPCVLSWNVDANKEFENWVFESTTNTY